jgi:hypothetical protein
LTTDSGCASLLVEITMMLNKGIRSLLILAAVVTVGCMPCKKGDIRPVAWVDVRAEIAKYICVEVNTYPDGTVGYWFKHGTSGRCVDEQTSTPLAQAVETALEKARPLLIGIMPEYTGFVYDDSLPIEVSNAALQEAYLSYDMFLRPILHELPNALAKRCLTCLDQPAREQRPIRSLAWNDFKVYLSAYAWPDEVRPETDEDGNPTGKTVYSYHVCIGLNGVAEMIQEPDQQWVYVAYSIAINSRKFMDLASDHFGEIVKDESLRQLNTDSAKTQYLRQQLPERLAADKKLLPIACRFLEEHFDDLRIELDQCL